MIAPVAHAQVQDVAPPIFSSVDHLGVDASTGQFHLATNEVAIGLLGEGGLAFGRSWIGSGWRDSLAGTISVAGSVYTVSLGGMAESFTWSGSAFTSDQKMGATLAYASSKYTYTMRDGTVVEFDTAAASCSGVTSFWGCNAGTITKLTRPTGEVLTWTYTTASVGGATARRPQSVSNSFGYQIHFAYADDDPISAPELNGAWLQRVRTTGYNRAYFYCGDADSSCDLNTGGSWPYVTYSTATDGGVTTEAVTDRLSRVTRYVFSGGQMTNVRLPSSSSVNRLTVQYNSGKVSYVGSSMAGYDDGHYSYSDASGIRTTTIAPTTGNSNIIKTNLTAGWVTEYWADASGTRKTVLTRDGDGRVTRTTLANGRYTDVTYDARGNITQVISAPKTGSGLANITTSAAYPSTCANAKTCNQPTSTTDALGYRTDYSYSSTHGGVTRIKLPAPTGGTPIGSGTRPETRFGYTAQVSWFLDSSGNLVGGPSSYRVQTISACATGSDPTCIDTADETRVHRTFKAGNSTTPSNRPLSAVTYRSGNTSGSGAISLVTNFTYTVQGDVATINGPLSGSADTVYRYYDELRRLRAMVGPDPDGGGAMLRRVAKVDYDSDGLITTSQLGSVSSASSWASLTVLQQFESAYNANGLLDTAKIASLSADPPHAVSQYDYSAGSTVICSATRMNPATFASLPGSACNAATEGNFGPDRRSRPVRSGYFELTDIQDAFGTPEQRITATLDYSTSGELESLTDAESNETMFEYDDFGRLVKTSYPHPSTSDYEELTYDAYGRLRVKRLRDGTSVYFCYDNLTRLVKYSVTVSDTNCATPKVSYTYDLMGRTTQIVQSSHTNTYVYDVLSRLLSETQAGRTVSYEYDDAGRRTRMEWPDEFHVTYEYNAAGDLTVIKENGVTALATFGYDDLGRRTTLTRANVGVTGYSYNTASWLTALAHEPANGSYDDFVSLDYNPAGQIVERTPANPAYAHTPPAAFVDTYAANSLNQYTSAGGVTPTYDSRGNMTYDGAKTYGYDFANRLTTVSGSPTTNLSYDPAGRLYEVAGASTTRFVYDGVDMIAEYNTSGNVLRRYIHGPGLDEPLVWYEGSSTGDRRHLYADERGSVVAMEGGSVAVNTYGPFGEPGSGNTGRFQYTGQMWLPEAGLYHYKARAYNPDLGRFMQPDPIGYGDGMNLYAYVGNDPMNFRDPSGTMRLECWWHDYPNPKYDEEEIPRVQIDGFRSEVICAWMPEIQDFAWDLIWGLPSQIVVDAVDTGACFAAAQAAGLAAPNGTSFTLEASGGGAIGAGALVGGGVWYDAKTGEFGYFGSAAFVGGYGWEVGGSAGNSSPTTGLSLVASVNALGRGFSAELGKSSNGDTTLSGSFGIGGVAGSPGQSGGMFPTSPPLKAGYSALAGIKATGSRSCGKLS